MRKIILPVSLFALTLAACGSSDTAEDAAMDDMGVEDMGAGDAQAASATLMTPEGATIASVTATGSAGGVTINLEATGMEPGTYSVRVHETAICAGDFSSAGEVWNPDDASDDQQAGYLPNLEIGEDGTGSLGHMLSMAATWEGLMDEDGSAVIVYAGEDTAGDRMACGVLAAGE
ncbi:superoxide dismutase family protein [Alteraurantiacibacter aquimixticola]|uniref:Superoxide dismutase family protein n=1 Tax=Alteraurantiacibacter aquimixticola TaxID=2489173 RepID=A0A4T3EXZ7_9SPHN|nr:superoxide dismutase family protein [Alteraurantiacibacter aquimixticola]TIX49509.1 superoxide dismutase family protein [Alteraurantiacibacter aquimixticola]